MKVQKIRIIGAIALVIIILITLLVAPSKSQQQSGSTYNRKPDGYAAWFEYMVNQGVNIKRWEKPLSNLLENKQKKTTFLRINPSLTWFSISEKELNWLQEGNNLIVLGIRENPTEANFSTTHNSDLGIIKIDTTRRNNNQESFILGDKYGAIVWQESVGKGKITKIVTPHFAANAYQDYQGNYQFLSELVTQYNQPILVDEYLHGYKDKEIIEEEFDRNLLSYFWQTPLSIIIVQGLVLILICLWGFNNRFGPTISVSTPQKNNSQAYIDALAVVLQKAESSDFMVKIIGKEEQIKLQKKLGLGNKLLPPKTLVNEWQNQHQNQNKLALISLLKLQSEKRHLKETELLNWLNEWQKLLNFNSKLTNNDQKK